MPDDFSYAPQAPHEGRPPRPRSRWGRLPKWFRRFLLFWAAALLTLMLVGYLLYIWRGDWTPEHLSDWFRLGFGGM